MLDSQAVRDGTGSAKEPSGATLDGQQSVTYACSVVRVLGGDDVVMMVDLGVDNLFKRVRVKLQGVLVPDKNADRARHHEAKQQLIKALKGDCAIKLCDVSKGIWLVRLFVKQQGSWHDVNERLIARGFVYERPKTVAA